MTVNAYLIKEIKLKIKDDDLIIEKILERIPTFNLNHDKKILELFQKYGCDDTNDDLNGELIIDKNTWENVLNNISRDLYTPIELKIIAKITNDLKNNEIIYYKCF